jgi:ubiquinone/menaquinone biosynthesis C-methylase UbiE
MASMTGVQSYRGYRTIREDWERFYVEFPDVYDRFAVSSTVAGEQIHRLFDLSGKRVLDLACGTGRTTFAMAAHAESVVGVDPTGPMLAFARAELARLGLPNVELIGGSVEEFPPLAPRSFDVATMVHAAPFIDFHSADERPRATQAFLARRSEVLHPGGVFALVTTEPDWVRDHERAAGMARPHLLRFKGFLESQGFDYIDDPIETDYGSLDEALATYGFIFGELAIDYLLDTRTSRFVWPHRIYFWRAA